MKSENSFVRFTRHLSLPKPWNAVVGGAAALAVAIFGIQMGRAQYNLREAEGYLQKGFGTLAAETLEPVRFMLVKSQRGCEALQGAYFGAQRPDRLEWAAQACIIKHGESPGAFVGLAAARELMGRDEEATRILAQVMQAFPKAPDPYFRMAQILRRAKKDVDAAMALSKASELIPANNQVALDALQALAGVSKWEEARRIAERIKDVHTDMPEVKLVIARAMLKGGNAEGAKAQADMARAMIEKKPENKAAIMQAYADVFNPQAAAATDEARAPASSKKKH
jgi:predicted Zn-dependent protease